MSVDQFQIDNEDRTHELEERLIRIETTLNERLDHVQLLLETLLNKVDYLGGHYHWLLGSRVDAFVVVTGSVNGAGARMCGIA